MYIGCPELKRCNLEHYGRIGLNNTEETAPQAFFTPISARVAFVLIIQTSQKRVEAGHDRPASETPFKWRFAGGPIVARDCILTEICVCFMTFSINSDPSVFRKYLIHALL